MEGREELRDGWMHGWVEGGKDEKEGEATGWEEGTMIHLMIMPAPRLGLGLPSVNSLSPSERAEA